MTSLIGGGGDQRGVAFSERSKAPGDECVMSDSNSDLMWILSPIAITRIC